MQGEIRTEGGGGGGERGWLRCPMGVSAEDITDETDRLRAVCGARDIRVTRNRRFS
jgi:hypothetical protein